MTTWSSPVCPPSADPVSDPGRGPGVSDDWSSCLLVSAVLLAGVVGLASGWGRAEATTVAPVAATNQAFPFPQVPGQP